MLWLIDKLAGRWLDLRSKHAMRKDGHISLTKINDIAINEDGLTVTGMSPAIAVLADQAAAMLDFHNAQNYVEFDMYPRADHGLKSIRVVVAGANGEMPSAKCARLEEAQRQLLYTFWNILDGIIKQGDGDTLWADENTTAHEALVEVAEQYDPAVASEFQKRMEGMGSEESAQDENKEPVADARSQYPITIAKAPQEEVDAARRFMNELETKVIYDDTDAETLGRWVQNAYPDTQGIWERILLGYEVLIANACDPQLTYLHWKPEIKQLMQR